MAWFGSSSVDANVQVEDYVDDGHQDLGRDEDDDLFFFFCQQARDTGRKGKKKKRGGRRTDPLELLAVAVAQLLLEHGEQVGDDVEALRQQADALVHLEVAADGLVDGLELGLDPEELGRVEHGAVEVDADAQDEELADLHVDVRPRQGDLARQRQLRGYVLARVDRRRDQLFEEGGLRVEGDWLVLFFIYLFPPKKKRTLTLWASACEMASLVM